MMQKQKFKSRTLAVLAEQFRFTKKLRHTAYHGDNLLPLHESVETNAKMRSGGRCASPAKKKANFLTGEALGGNRREADIIDFGIGAPRTAAGDRNLELARQVIKFRIAAKLPVELQRQRSSIAVLVRVETRERASGNIARDITASACGRQSHPPQRLKNVRQRFDSHPMQLHVLPHRNVRHPARVALAKDGDEPRLLTTQEAVGNADAHHKERRPLAFAV